VHRDRKFSNPILISQSINVAPTEGIEVLQNYKSDNGNTASTSEKMVRIQEFIFKTAKVYVKRNSPIGCLVANSFAYLLIVKEVTV